MQSNVGVGIIGSGFMGRTWTEVAAHHTPSARLAAIAGGRRAPGLAGEYDVRALAIPDLFARRDVTAVVLATPPSTHVDLAVAAAAVGKHVFIEKPMATTIADCDRIIDACDAAGVRLAVVSQHRWRNTPRAAHRLVDEGAIGEVRMIRVMGPTAGWDAPDDTWKMDPDEQTAFADWGAHACDITRWFAGSEPTLAYARSASFSPTPPPEQSTMAIYEFGNGVLADFWLTYEIPQPGLGSALQFLITGSDGMLEFDAYGALRHGKGDEWTTVYEQPPFDPLDPNSPGRLEAYALQLGDFLASIGTDRRPAVDGRSGRATTEMLEAADRSVRSGQAVRLPLHSIATRT
ncbi:MAG TPA: Gfo/Idh/MocA family oxidoreductase [Candidatus Saccharimonadales bacterium]|nr:Gfo/Idh/MocA family oxidoreductase [Candidatus Saccharimonadales bacterium]